MTHAGHKVVKCAACHSVVMQCRCLSPNKPVYYQPGPCAHCRAAAVATIDGPVQPLTPTDLTRMEQQARAGQATPAMVLALVAEVRRARLTADTALGLVQGGGR